MRTLKTITFTGVDERTPLAWMQDVLEQYPDVEFGLLYTFAPEDRHRYPSTEWLVKATRALGKRCAVHICGSRARSVALSGRDWIGRAGRIQFNGPITADELQEALSAYRTYGCRVITQHNPAKHSDLSGVYNMRHELLVDASGGEGRSPEAWERPATFKRVGFAGGLGPHNLATELLRISEVAGYDWWVDMESHLRDENDWFDYRRVYQCLDVWHAWKEA